jgi:hypothetical protein
MKLASQSFAVRLLSSAVTLAALVSACGGGDDEAPDTESEAGASGAADGGTTATGGSSGKGGTATTGGSAGKNGSGGTRASGGNAGSAENEGGEAAVGGSGGAGGSGEGGSGADEGKAGNAGGVGLDDSGKASLGSDDGITGIASGTLFARKLNTSVEMVTPEYFLLEADDGEQGDWTLRIPTKVGVYSCDSQVSADVATISLNNQATHDIRGTSTVMLGGGCTLEVTSVYGPIEGRFVGTLVGILGALHPVTSGYFRFSESPLGDCSKAEDPGVEDDEFAATMSITKIETQGGVPWKCGTNGKLPATTSTPGDNPYFHFAGNFDDRDHELFINGINGTGTFTCGTAGVKLGSGLIWGGDNGGSCTIEVTEYADDAIVGTYEATMWNGIVAAHSTVHLEGSFRTKRQLSPF